MILSTLYSSDPIMSVNHMLTKQLTSRDTQTPSDCKLELDEDRIKILTKIVRQLQTRRISRKAKVYQRVDYKQESDNCLTWQVAATLLLSPYRIH